MGQSFWRQQSACEPPYKVTGGVEIKNILQLKLCQIIGQHELGVEHSI